VQSVYEIVHMWGCMYYCAFFNLWTSFSLYRSIPLANKSAVSSTSSELFLVPECSVCWYWLSWPTDPNVKEINFPNV